MLPIFTCLLDRDHTLASGGTLASLRNHLILVAAFGMAQTRYARNLVALLLIYASIDGFSKEMFFLASLRYRRVQVPAVLSFKSHHRNM